jgi:VIT1/CCC1 family predicted Fe2+/Mn2+ transporter
MMNSDEHHKTEGGLLKPMIFGGLDGILTSFAIVAGAAGGNLSSGVVLILGFSNIFADALSMGVGEFLSSKAENEWILSERRREEWELENYPEGEIREMVDFYMEKGMSRQDAEIVITTMAKYKDFFVDIMMTQELQLQVPEDDHVTESFREGTCCSSWSRLSLDSGERNLREHILTVRRSHPGVIMFCSFAFFGALPLVGYLVFPSAFPNMSEEELFLAACAVTGVVLFFLGSVKSTFW